MKEGPVLWTGLEDGDHITLAHLNMKEGLVLRIGLEDGDHITPARLVSMKEGLVLRIGLEDGDHIPLARLVNMMEDLVLRIGLEDGDHILLARLVNMKEGLVLRIGIEDGDHITPTRLVNMKEGLVLRIGIEDGLPLQNVTEGEPTRRCPPGDYPPPLPDIVYVLPGGMTIRQIFPFISSHHQLVLNSRVTLLFSESMMNMPKEFPVWIDVQVMHEQDQVCRVWFV